MGELKLKSGIAESVSSQLYGIEWRDYFPQEICEEGFSVRHVPYEECVVFLEKNFAEINEIGKSLLIGDVSKNKSQYYQVLGDCFLFEDKGIPIAVFIGNPHDWSTYYIRSMSVLKKYQGKKIFQTFLFKFLDILFDHGVTRADVDIAVSNTINIHLFNKLGFNVMGHVFSERWGSLIKFRKLLNREDLAEFLGKFCYGIKPQLKLKSIK